MSKEKIMELVHNGGDIEAYLNAVRAEGLDMAAAEIDRWVGCDLLAREIRQKSAQLRAGNAGRDGV